MLGVAGSSLGNSRSKGRSLIQMEAVKFERPMSMDEAVDAVVTNAEQGSAVIDSAREYAHLVDDRDVLELVVQGLADMAHARLHRQRRNDKGSAAESSGEIEAPAGGAPPKAKKHYAKEGWALLTRSNYEAADGTRKPLIRFTLADWQHLRSEAGGKAAGWIRLRDAADRAISAMQQHDVDTTAALPAAEKQAISGRLA